MLHFATWLAFATIAYRGVVLAAKDGGLQVSLYEVGPHDEEVKNELTSEQLVRRNLSCFDRETVDLVKSDENTLDMSSMFGPVDEQQEEFVRFDGRTNSSVDLPSSLSLKFSENIDPTDSTAVYHLNHLATIARILNDVEVRRGALAYHATYPPSNVTFREDEIDVVYLPDYGLADGPSGLQLKRVPAYCKALLSDKECLNNAVRSTLPHSVDQIGACVDVLFQNLVKFHSFFRLPSSRLNVTRLANNCIQDSLKQFNERTVKCFHGPVVVNQTGGGDLASHTQQKYQTTEPYKTFSFDFESTVQALKSHSTSLLLSRANFSWWFFSTVLFHLINRV